MTGPTTDLLRDSLTAVLGAQYDIVRLLGKGGMGAVYLGRERLLDRPVAIKILPHESADTADARERFLREARMAAKLTHPNIVPLYSFGEAGKTLFYVMGYVEGESLEQRLNREGRIGFDETRRILGELAAALEHAHAHGIVHRDIKPDNVLVEARTGRAVLTDFGVAKQQVGGHTLTHTGTILGTPHYMSPEQASGDRDLDGRSDIYALGIIGYRMLTGRLPFDGGSLQELIAQQISREPVALSVLLPDVPADLDSAIAKCLAKDPAHRWSNAALLRDAVTSGEVESALPYELEEFPSSAASMLVFASMGTLLMSFLTFLTDDADWVRFALYGWAAVLVTQAYFFAQGRWRDIPWRRLLRLALWQPRWWPLSWPRSLRRPGDVLDQLPADVRRVRSVISAGAAAAIVFSMLAMLSEILRAIGISLPHWVLVGTESVGAGGAMASLLGILAAFGYSTHWPKKYQLSTSDADKLTAEPTWGSKFWKRTDIARLLRAQPPLSISGTPANPAEIVAEIEKVSAVVTGPLHALAKEALAAASDMARAIASIDRELGVLSREADPAERKRLHERLAALRPPQPEDLPSSRQMRDLLATQLQLMDQLTTRCDELSNRRARYVELMRTLWLQVSTLRAQHAVDALGSSEVSGRIRDLCQSAANLIVAEVEVERQLLPALGAATPPVKT